MRALILLLPVFLFPACLEQESSSEKAKTIIKRGQEFELQNTSSPALLKTSHFSISLPKHWSVRNGGRVGSELDSDLNVLFLYKGNLQTTVLYVGISAKKGVLFDLENVYRELSSSDQKVKWLNINNKRWLLRTNDDVWDTTRVKVWSGMIVADGSTFTFSASAPLSDLEANQKTIFTILKSITLK